MGVDVRGGEGRGDEVKEECPFGSVVYIQRPATPTQNTLRISVEKHAA